MSYWKCIKTLKMEGDIERGPYQAFIEGQVYFGHVSATPAGEWAMSFTNDMGDENHLMTARWLHEYFVKVEVTEAEKEADREAERQELWQPGDEPYEPDYWGPWYE
jgi:hypothetical protein